MAQNTNNLLKQYYSVTPIQDLEQIDINDLTLNSEGEVDLIPIGLHGRTISNSISLRDLQTAIDTIGYIPQEARSGNTLEQTIGGLMSKQDKWNLDHFNLKNGNAQGSLRNILSSVQDENYQLGKGAISLGCNTKASGQGSYAQGASNNSWFGTFKTEATGYGSHAEGCGTLASGKGAHAQGVLQEGGNDEAFQTKAIGEGSHAEGCGTLASGHGSHAEGLSFDGKNAGVPHLYSLKATGEGSHAGGAGTEAIGNYSTTQGLRTRAINKSQTVIGEFNITDNTGSSSTRGKYAFIIGNGNDNGLDQNYSNALTVDWDGKVESFGGYATQDNHLTTKGYVDNTINNAINSIDIGLQNLVDGEAIGSVQGIEARAIGQYSFAQGNNTQATEKYAHAEGEGTIASGFASHAEGGRSYATNTNSHAEGCSCNASGYASHAEGDSCDAIGDYSHAEGLMTTARGNHSHTSGKGTIANNNNEFVIGSYNNFQHIEKETENIQTILIDINNMSQSYTLLQTPVEDTQIICNFYCLNDQDELVQPYQISFIVGRADGDQHNWLSGTYDGDQTFVFEWSGTEEELLDTKLKIKGVSIKYNVISQQDNNIFVIGNGTDDSHRSNLFTIEKDTGDIWTPGNITSNNIITPSATIDTITTNNLNIGQGVNIIDKIFPIGSVYGCSPDLNPNNFLNGTWQITNKYLKRAWYSTTSADGKISNGTQIMQWATNVVDTNKTIGFVANPQGTLLQLRSVFTLKTAYQDTAAKDNMVVWTLYGDKIGLKLSDEALHQVYCIGASDGMNAIVYATLVWSVTDGNKPRAQLRIQDMITRSATIPSSTYSIGFSINYQIPQEHIEDSFCNKIEWTRIS